jgi:hypothetical protein
MLYGRKVATGSGLARSSDAMDLMNASITSEGTPEAEADDVELGNIRPTIEVAIAMDDVAYKRGWTEALQAVRAALEKAGGSKSDEYFEGYMDAVTLEPADALRLTKTRSRYARGYTEGARAYDLAHRGGGYDAE